MPTTDTRIDDYISKSADFAKPILSYIRQVVHAACPEVQETMKWSFPHFEYANNILCSMAAFKQHASFTFWLGKKMKDPEKLLRIGDDKTSMGDFGQVKSIDDLLSKETFADYIREAMELIEAGVKISRPVKKEAKQELEIPAYFLELMAGNEAAMTHFEKFNPSEKKDYVEWLTEAKTEATRVKRLTTAMEWIAEGKSRHWKYKK